MSSERIAELERQVALLRAQLAAVQELPNSSIEARLRALLGDRMVLEALPGIVSVLDCEQKIVYLNRTVPGRNLADFYGTDARAFVVEEDRERYAVMFRQAWDGGRPASVALRTLSGRHWETSLIPVLDQGQVVFMLVTSTDVTDRVRSEQALRDSEARLRHALGASGMGAWTYLVADDRVSWDATAAELFGVPLLQAPRNFAEYLERVHPDDRQRVRDAVQEYVRTGSYADLEHRVVLADGGVRYLLCKGTALLDESGRTLGLRGGVFDVTARKALEGQLLLAQKMQAVGQLTSGVAHNLNNALSVIIPNAEECKELASGELRARIEDMAHAARRAAEMVRQLTLFARPHASAEKRPFDLAETARRIVDMCRKTFDRRIRLVLETEPALLAHGDEGQIEQVLLNVCLNARDALVATMRERERDALGSARERDALGSTRESPTIWVGVRPAEAGRARITIRDNGGGMSEAVRARIFEPFFTTKEVGRGSGLGLASAYAILQDHGGAIRCTSEPGQGTSFELELPLAANGARPHLSVAPRPEPAKGRERVLIVDDEAPVRRVLSSILRRAGYEVTQCASGTDAVELFEGGEVSFDVVLLDRSMPGLGGEQVASRLTSLGVGTPVILLTGDPGGGGRLPGIALVVSKPVDSRQLLANVRAVLDRDQI